jgi:hypothetical protein
MMSREAMKLALEALEILTDGYDGTEVGVEIEAITALRQALEHMNPFAGEIKMEKVIKDGKEVIECEQVDGIKPIEYAFAPQATEYAFAPHGKEWARIDKDMNVTHLDMELCAKGPHNAYTALAMAIWKKAIETEREACAKVCEERQEVFEKYYTKGLAGMCAEAIRARSKCERGDAGTKISEDISCKTHPDAPHGFDRNMSHTLDRYVCECESWEPKQEPVECMFVNEDGECEQIEYGPVFDDPGVTPLYAGQLKAAEYIEQHFGVRE